MWPKPEPPAEGQQRDLCRFAKITLGLLIRFIRAIALNGGNRFITVIGPDVVAHHSAIATASTKSSWAPAGVVGRPPRVGHLAFRVGKRSRDLQLASVQTRA